MLWRQSNITRILRFLRSSSMQTSTMENELLHKCQHEDTTKTYNEAIAALNNLVSNNSAIREISKQNQKHSNNIEVTSKYIKRLGIDLDQLSGKVIHVTGTKGKGSTCALTEAILRAQGFTTGFFSSPHLFSVTERIRLNGQPISERAFSYYFWRVYNKLSAEKDHDEDMPTYFKFLTLLAFHILIEKNVDVAIIEVGIGGEYDCTNVLRKTPVIGITSLGFDHMNVLGNTIEEIAWMKAGIMKEGCVGFTCDDQPPEAMAVLFNRAKERQSKLFKVARHIDGLKESNPAIHLNAPLAVRLAHAWMYTRKGMNLLFPTNNFSWDDDFAVPEKTIEAIRKCHWPGRFQILKRGNVTYFLDGAHTSESIEYCSKWFSNNTTSDEGKRVLVFNLTGNRDPVPLLKSLIPCSFDETYFSPNILSESSSIPNDIKIKPSSAADEICMNNKTVWEQLGGGKATVTGSVYETLQNIGNRTTNVNVLVTGSLHLVGNTLKILQPDLWS